MCAVFRLVGEQDVSWHRKTYGWSFCYQYSIMNFFELSMATPNISVFSFDRLFKLGRFFRFNISLHTFSIIQGM